MSYSTSHSAREYLKAATLFICHDYILMCQRRAKEEKKRLIQSTREIDLCARLASHFGTTAHPAALGTNDADLLVDGPTIRGQVKYFVPPASSWQAIRSDWDWLLAPTNVGEEFAKRAWMVFLPGRSIFHFTNCLSVTRSHGAAFCTEDYAPFVPFVTPAIPTHGQNQRLVYRPDTTISRSSFNIVPGGKRVRVDIVGSLAHPLWCAIYTRATPADLTTFAAFPQITTNTVPCVV